jgi:hypothetical protein
VLGVGSAADFRIDAHEDTIPPGGGPAGAAAVRLGEGGVSHP